MAPFNLTLGVELEFVVHFNRADYQDELLAAESNLWSGDFRKISTLYEKYGTLVSQLMVRILNENGFPTNGYMYENFSKWTVASNGTVAPVDQSGDWYPIEVKTPVLCYSESAFEQITRVVNLLVSNFQLYTNESCGLHVHVGNGNNGFTLHTLKNFCSLITAFDRQLDSLHPPHRLQNPNAKSVRRGFYAGASPREKMMIIDNLNDVEQLVYRFHILESKIFDRYMALNFFNLLDGLEKPSRTIEFRQHRGTLDPRLITNWVKVAYNLVRISYTETASIRMLIEKQCHNTKYTVIDLFKDLKLSELAEFYTPLAFPQYGTDLNLPLEDDFKEDEEPRHDPQCRGKYDTLWEKTFAPDRLPNWPRKKILYEDTHPKFGMSEKLEKWLRRGRVCSGPYRGRGRSSTSLPFAEFYTPVAFPQYGTDLNLPLEDDFKENYEPRHDP